MVGSNIFITVDYGCGDLMTIKSISKLNGFGIFNNYTNAGVQDFGKYNLFYGWNGSGKSTLSNLFRCIENRSQSEKFPTASFNVNIEDGSIATQDNLGEANLNIYTFNQDFIDENISWNSLVKSILLVDKEKIADREKLDQLKKQQQIDTESNTKEAQEILKLEASIAKFGTDSARHMKTSLQSIDTTDRYYLNYDKRKFEDFVDEHLDATKSDTSLVDDVKIIELTNAAKPNQKSQLTFTPQIVNHESFTKAKTRLDDLLKTSVVSQTIQRLLDHSDIKTWVETGLDLHKQHDSHTCEFCGNLIAVERVKQLEAHFNDDYKSFQNRLVRADEWLSEQYVQRPQLPVESDFYDEFKKEYAEACESLEKAIKALNAEIAEWHNTLKSKTNSPLETGLLVKFITENSIKTFINAIAAIESAIQKHNHKSSNFQEETTKAKKQLELHYATTEVKSFEYHKKKKDKIDRTITNNSLKVVIDTRRIEIRALEDSLSNESLGAEQFNESLHKFLGRSELTLHFNKDKKGYEILRNDSEQVNGKLSEGEKTAIAFVYFITKLHENDNKMLDTIVVVDDPVSSFDSNHLFHAYSFLRTNCDLAKQIFVLTHNFTYFKLMRDWFEGVNKGRRRKQKDANAFFFTIEASTSLPRHSTIKNADSSLVNYDSEYHYIFSKLHNYINNPTLSRDEAFLTANLSRKLLESFFSFKYPKHRTDIAQLMACGLKACKITDENIKEKIYRFINKYSHSAVIEINEDSSDNLVGESQNVIGNIFTWIKEVDEVHYNEMLEVMGA